jgi:hypothetical protein
MSNLYRNILLSFLKQDSVQHKPIQDLLNINFEQAAIWLSDKEIRIGKLSQGIFHC